MTIVMTETEFIAINGDVVFKEEEVLIRTPMDEQTKKILQITKALGEIVSEAEKPSNE